MTAKLDRKFRREILLGRYFLNPLSRAMGAMRLTPRAMIEIETTGRTSGQKRRVPVFAKLDSSGLWIIAQHGRKAGWVVNLEADPAVRVKLGARWRAGNARIVDEDDVDARRGTFGSGAVSKKITAAGIKALQTRPISVRVDFA
jgi:deazaflavin-dependent oxidoreductase (nitroreductase family)